MAPPVPSLVLSRTAWRGGVFSVGSREVAEETPIAITYNRVTHAVMMATPADLHDFAVGFSLSEEIVPSVRAIEEFSAVQAEGGIELRLWIGAEHMQALEKRRRRLAGATGCGMCGLESLGEALRPVPPMPETRPISALDVQAACASLGAAQRLNRATRAVHGAGFWTRESGLVALREDVGRHNALDKLGGALALASIAPTQGVVLLTSRISIELIQKAGRMGAPILVAVSAPTALAIRAAEAAQITLVGIARDDGFEIFTCPERIVQNGLRAS